MKTCYVSIPSGARQDVAGRTIDFDRVYAELLRPALERAGVTASRADELTTGAVIHRSVLQAVLGSDVMVADLTAANPNVMYEVGLRHASRRSVTVLVMANGTRIPFNLNLVRVLTYALAADGGPDPAQADWFRDRLASTVREAVTRVTSDSPVFEFFPDMHVELPAHLSSGREVRKRAGIAEIAAKSGVLGAISATGRIISPVDEVRLSEKNLRERGTADPFDYITVLRSYRDASAWDDLIRAFESMPADAARAPEAIHLAALALNRRNRNSDRDRAVAIIRQLIDETGGSAEAYGILGRIYKDQYEDDRGRGDAAGASRSLDEAIDAYLKGFEVEPSEYYPGVNAVTLLMQRGTAHDRSRAQALIPRVREAVRLRMRDGSESYWELATDLELAVLEGSWSEASDVAARIAATEPTPWMLETTVRQLRMLAELRGDPPDNVRGVLARLQADAEPQTESR